MEKVVGGCAVIAAVAIFLALPSRRRGGKKLSGWRITLTCLRQVEGSLQEFRVKTGVRLLEVLTPGEVCRIASSFSRVHPKELPVILDIPSLHSTFEQAFKQVATLDGEYEYILVLTRYDDVAYLEALAIAKDLMQVAMRDEVDRLRGEVRYRKLLQSISGDIAAMHAAV